MSETELPAAVGVAVLLSNPPLPASAQVHAEFPWAPHVDGAFATVVRLLARTM